MKRIVKILLAVAAALLILVGSIAVGSVNLSPGQVAEILMAKLSGGFGTVDPNLSAIVWEMRFPRAVLAFLTGAALSASGTVMQSILKNPLASSYTLGVSSGASLCAALVMVTGVTFPLLGSLFTLPAEMCIRDRGKSFISFVTSCSCLRVGGRSSGMISTRSRVAMYFM